ncbi:MAG: porin [Candidatus Methylacidiphilales bacterium]
MKLKYFILTSFIFTSLFVSSQNPILNKYTFGEGLKFTGKNNSETTINGYMQPSLEVKYNSNDSLGTTDVYNRFRMRRLRLRVGGDLPKYKIEYRIQLDFSGTPEIGDDANGSLFDAWIAYNPSSNFQIKFGQSIAPTENLELLMGSNALQLPERSRITSAFGVVREFGIFTYGDFKIWKNFFIKPALAITNGDGPNILKNDKGGFKIGGRIDFLPFGKFNNLGQFRQADEIRERTPKLLIGFIYSINYGVSSRRGEGNTITYLNDSLQEVLPNFTKYGADFLFKYRGFSLLGEYIQTLASVPNDIFYKVRTDGSLSTNFDVNGIPNIENHVKGRMMLGSGFNIQAGYFFKSRISVDARYASLRADINSFLNNGSIYNRPNYYTLGISKYLSKGYGFKIQASATYVEVSSGSLDVLGKPLNNNEWIGNLITTISF